MADSVIAPPFVISATDKRGLIVLTVAIVFAFVWTCLCISTWLRWRLREWKIHDSLLAIAALILTVQSGLVLHLVRLGLGTSLEGVPLPQRERIGREGFASQILYILTLAVSKCSILCLYLRLSPGGTHRIGCFVALAASAVWAVIAIVLIATPCNPIQVIHEGSARCTNRWPKWQAITALDIVTEAAIFAIAVHLVWQLQMRLKTKATVILAFSARLPLIALATLRLHYLHHTIDGTDDTFEYLVVTQWQMGYAIMSSTLSGLGPFLKPFTKEYTTSYKTTGSAYAHSKGRSLPRSHDRSRHDTTGDSTLPRNSWHSEGYLMQPLPKTEDNNQSAPSIGAVSTDSRTREFNAVPATAPQAISTSPSPYPSSSPASTTSHLSQTATIIPVADANFNPTNKYLRNDAEVWVGDRNGSVSHTDDLVREAEDRALSMDGRSRNLIISKRTQFKVEVDRASRVI